MFNYKELKLREKIVILWILVAFIFWIAYSLVVSVFYPIFYFFTWIFFFGIPVLKYKNRISTILQNWRLNSFIKFLVLGYGTVMAKDVVKAFFIVLSEGFKINLFFTRVTQLWALNTMALTGFIVGWYFLITRIFFSDYEIFYVAGAYGLFSEDIIYSLIINPIGFLFLAPLEICVYGLIITPAVLSIKNRGNRTIISLLKYIVAIFIIIAFSFIPVSIVTIVKIYFPELIPPNLFGPWNTS